MMAHALVSLLIPFTFYLRDNVQFAVTSRRSSIRSRHRSTSVESVSPKSIILRIKGKVTKWSDSHLFEEDHEKIRRDVFSRPGSACAIFANDRRDSRFFFGKRSSMRESNDFLNWVKLRFSIGFAKAIILSPKR